MRWRLLISVLVILAASASTTVVFGRGQIDQLTHALGTHKSITLSSGTVAPVGFGGAQTLLLIGNDQRAHTTTNPVLPHSNEMLMVRIDPNKPWISMLSIPRELQVPIHTPHNGIVTTRLNAALFYGGINLVVRTIKQVTGLSVNHVVVIDFNNFKHAVDEMGCVYGLIDRRYFHVNVPGGAQYFQVNLQPGYQQLCGEQALQFVTYRHDDTSLERDARDQAFLLEVKQQYGPTLIDHIHEFEQIFAQTVSTDPSLHTSDGVLNLLGTLISSAGKPVRQVRFRVTMGAQTNCDCVTADQQQISTSVNAFLNGSGVPPSKRSTSGLAKTVQKHATGGEVVPVAAPQLAQQRGIAHRLSFPMELPSVAVDYHNDGLPTAFRSYRISAPGGSSYPIYVAVYSVGLLGQYYDVQGTTWKTAPLFDDPSQAVTVARRTYYIYYSGSHIAQIAWFTNRGAYWVHNTLTSGLSNAQMLTVAERSAPVIGAAAGSPREAAVRQAPPPASVVVAASGTSALHTIGVLGGLVTLLALIGGLVMAVVLQLRFRGLSGQAELVNVRLLALEQQLTGSSWLPPAVGGSAVRSRFRLVGISTASSVACVAVALVAVRAATTHAAPPPRPAAHHVARVSAPIAVLNAGTKSGSAAQLARTLRRQGLDVLGAANLNSTPPNGYQVLYAPGEANQARLLSRLLKREGVSIAPVDPAAQAASGGHAKLVVVIP